MSCKVCTVNGWNNQAIKSRSHKNRELETLDKWVAIKKLKTPCRGVGGWVKVPFLTTWILKIWEIYKYKSAKIGISGNFADFNRYFVNFERFLRYGWYGHIKYVSKMGWVGGSKCHSWPHGKWTTWCARFFYCHPLDSHQITNTFHNRE